MSKAVKWQIPFVSTIEKTKYRIDIYADGYSGNPIQLLGGPQPFVTEENKSDGFFIPVRSQTGNIQVCTRKQDGTYLTLDEIQPWNNIDVPVRLVSINGNTEATVWQGFLSDEIYSQEYKGTPEVLSFPVNSMLQAMDSIEVEYSNDTTFMTFIQHIAYVFNTLYTKTGLIPFRNVYITDYCLSGILNKKIYNSTYFLINEIQNGDNIVIDYHSVSCMKILEMIASFFGCCWREQGQDLYLVAIGKNGNASYQSCANIISSYTPINPSSLVWTQVSESSENIADFAWRGSKHKVSVMNGAKRVEVKSQLSKFETGITLEECPVNTLVENPIDRQSDYGEVNCNTNETFYNLAEHQHIDAKITVWQGSTGIPPRLEVVNMQQNIGYEDTIFWSDNDFRTNYTEYIIDRTMYNTNGIPFMLTSYMAYWRNPDNELVSGLMVCGVPTKLYTTYQDYRAFDKFTLTENNAIFKQQAPFVFVCYGGFLKFNLHVGEWRDASGLMTTPFGSQSESKLTVAIKFGDKWWNGSAWVTSFSTFQLTFNQDGTTKGNWNDTMPIDETDGFLIRLDPYMRGLVTFYIYHEMDAVIGDFYTDTFPAFDVFLDKIEISYVPLPSELKTARSENIYAKQIHKYFSKEISTQLYFASYTNNENIASLVWNAENSPVRLMNIGGKVVRPENELISRMASYYGEVRNKLELQAKHPTNAALPMLKLNGINDGRIYLPLAESRDWIADVATLTCFETPE